ncbi:MAG: SBBP repeat-containing protein, partial [Bryobacteraceae bacterium]
MTQGEAVLSLQQTAGRGIVRTRLVNGNPRAQVSGLDRLPGTSNYFSGNDSAKWRTGVPAYARIKYQSVYPGVDLVYYGNQGKLEYDFVVAPGADRTRIQVSVQAEKGNGVLTLDGNGDLVAATESGEVRFQKPVAYQLSRNGERQIVSASYSLMGADRVAFQIAQYDQTRPLIVDPVLSYSTYLGGSGSDSRGGMAVDASGNVYLTGSTDSADFPTLDPAQHAYAGGVDAFVTKINAAGTAIIYSTYLGGSSTDQGFDIAVDPIGNGYVVGTTTSQDFPTVNPFQSANRFQYSAFVAKLNPSGNQLLYSTYLGGSGQTFGIAITADGAGSGYVVGETLAS